MTTARTLRHHLYQVDDQDADLSAADLLDILAGPTRARTLYAVQAARHVSTPDRPAGVDHLPTFYLDAAVQGIVDVAHARRIALDILGPDAFIVAAKQV